MGISKRNSRIYPTCAALRPAAGSFLRTACLFVPAGIAALSLAGCRQDMQDQPKFYPQRGTTAFADGRSARPQVAGTVARSQGEQDDYFHTGLKAGAEGDGLPFPVTAELLARGQERYNIYCSPCHSRTGYGNGMIVQRGYYPAASIHTERLRTMPLGHFFSVITNGYGIMPDYAAQIVPEDRWAIAAYIRALQLSQNAQPADLPPQAHPQPLKDIAALAGLEPGMADMSFWRATAAKAPSVPPPAKPAPPATPAKAEVSAANSTKASPTAASSAPDKPKPAAPAVAKTPAGDAVAGHTVYEDNCSICHQSDLSGKPPVFPALSGVVARKGEAHVRKMVAEGAPDARPMMPAFGDRLSSKEVDDLVAFVKSAKR